MTQLIANLVAAIERDNTIKSFILIKKPTIKKFTIVDVEEFGVINPYTFNYNGLTKCFHSFMINSFKHMKTLKIDGVDTNYTYMSMNANERAIIKRFIPFLYESSVDDVTLYTDIIKSCIDIVCTAIDNSTGILMREDVFTELCKDKR